MIKILENIGLEEAYLNIIKVMYEKSTAKINLNIEKFEEMH